MSSSLPTLDDLQARARQPLGHPEKRSQQTIPVVVTPTTILQERESRQSTTNRLFRKCTTVFQCSRYKSDLPAYNPLHLQMSSTASSTYSLASNIPEFWRRRGILLIATILVSTLIFWTAVVLWNINKHCLTIDPREDHHKRLDQRWFKDATFYEIFPASFQDTDYDGYGDFQGIIQHLDYIRDLGMTAIRLNSLFSALDYPLEFEHVIDLRSPDPHLGRSEDFGRLVQEAHARGLRVVLELNPTVTSDQYTWALHWQRGIPGYEHFYASANRSKAPPEMENSEGPPPEDWELTQRTFGGHYVLNWSNPFVQEEYKKALSHWIDLGVDGIYMKHLDKMHVIDNQDIPGIIQQWRKVLDRPRRTSTKKDHDKTFNNCDQTHEGYVPHISIFGSPPTNTVPYQEQQQKKPSAKSQCHGRRVLIVSSKFVDGLTMDLGRDSQSLQVVLKNVDLLDYPILVGSGEEMAQQVSSLGKMSSLGQVSNLGQVSSLGQVSNLGQVSSLGQVSGWPVPMWHLGSSDTFRVASRIEPRYQMAAFYLLMTLPGATSVFYGDEIGLKDSFDVANGRVYRGGQLAPMQWTSDNSTAGGFTDNTTEPWLPLNPEHASTNVQSQQNRLQEFIRLANYRRNTLQHYSNQDLRFDVLEPNVVVLERTHKVHKSKKVLLAANFGSMSEEKDFPEAYGNIRAALTTPGPTRTRVRSRGFTISPGAAFIAELTLQHSSSPIPRRD